MDSGLGATRRPGMTAFGMTPGPAFGYKG